MTDRTTKTAAAIDIATRIDPGFGGDTSWDSLKSDHVLVLPNGKRHGVGAIPRHAKGRKEFGGALIQGPWAYAFPLGTYITSDRNRNSGADARDNRAAGIEHDVDNGSRVIIDGVEYAVRVVRRDWIELDAV